MDRGPSLPFKRYFKDLQENFLVGLLVHRSQSMNWLMCHGVYLQSSNKRLLMLGFYPKHRLAMLLQTDMTPSQSNHEHVQLSTMSLRSRFGAYVSQAPFLEQLRRSHAQRSVFSRSRVPSIISTMYLPRTGRNFHAWNEPPAATKVFAQPTSGLMIHSWSFVQLSLNAHQQLT